MVTNKREGITARGSEEIASIYKGFGHRVDRMEGDASRVNWVTRRLHHDWDKRLNREIFDWCREQESRPVWTAL